jgi:hypothetical protein
MNPFTDHQKIFRLSAVIKEAAKILITYTPNIVFRLLGNQCKKQNKNKLPCCYVKIFIRNTE